MFGFFILSKNFQQSFIILQREGHYLDNVSPNQDNFDVELLIPIQIRDCSAIELPNQESKNELQHQNSFPHFKPFK